MTIPACRATARQGALTALAFALALAAHALAAAEARADGPLAPAARGPFTPAVWLEPTVPPAAAASDREGAMFGRLVGIATNLSAHGRYDEAAARLEGVVHMAEAHGAPPSIVADALFSLGAARFRLGDAAAGAAAVERAVTLGYADPMAFHETLPASARANERVRAAYARMALTDLDLEELWWARREIRALHHDTMSLITANMGRKDSDWTQLATVAIPSRPTANTAVQGFRSAIHFVQGHQRQTVFQSDQSRIMHLVNAGIIEKMGPPVDERRKQEEVRYSRDQAERRHREMVAAIAGRQLAIAPGAAATPVAPPPLGSLDMEVAMPPAAARRLDLAPAAFDVRPGDWARFDVTIAVEGVEPVRQSTHEWVTAARGGLVSTVVVRRGADGGLASVEDVGTLRLANGRDDLLLQLSELGPVELSAYEAKAGTRTFRGRTVAADERRLATRLGSGEEAVSCTVRVVVSPEVAGGAHPLELDLERPGLRYSVRLVDCGLGPR